MNGLRQGWRKKQFHLEGVYTFPHGLNYDCSYRQQGRLTSSAWITRDSNGFFKNAGRSKGNNCSSVLEAELQSVGARVQKKVIFGGDTRLIQSLVEGKTLHFVVRNWIREIKYWKRRFEEVEIIWTKRQNNKAADRSVKEPLIDDVPFVSYFFVPSYLVNLLHEDHLSILFSHRLLRNRKMDALLNAALSNAAAAKHNLRTLEQMYEDAINVGLGDRTFIAAANLVKYKLEDAIMEAIYGADQDKRSEKKKAKEEEAAKKNAKEEEEAAKKKAKEEEDAAKKN
ncbi:hypothetical protein CARUB_v10015250mg, partial [Capsella rubella]